MHAGSTMNMTRLVIGAGLIVAAALPVYAHHSFAAEFDPNKTVTLTGAVTKVEWFNPHIWVYLDVKDDQGTLQHWQCEGGAPNTLTRNGWSKDSLKPATRSPSTASSRKTDRRPATCGRSSCPMAGACSPVLPPATARRPRRTKETHS